MVPISIVILWCQAGFAGQNQRRNRGESYYDCRNSNTPGPGNIWLSLHALSHVWDNSPVTTDTLAAEADGSDRKWVSNVRAFPEFSIQAGVTDFLSVQAGSRLLSYGFRPGWYKGGIKCTWPNNKTLRFHGFGLSLDYLYLTRESSPSLGGYVGFMPEGFVVKGGNLESLLIYELDFLPKYSVIPVRLLFNGGVRIPLEKRRELYQMLMKACVVYSGHNFDFFAQYSIEAFNNITSPAIIDQEGNKRFLVWFSENPMYATLGGNIRYENGVTLSLAVPLLLSVNQGSGMRYDDCVELNRKETPGLFTYEKEHGIVDPFDPWYVRWKITGTISIPLRFKMTGSEMMRNYLLLKNKKADKKIDIDSRIEEQESPDTQNEEEDTKRRLEEIKKKRKKMLE
jgi:hypothetical protein